MYKLISEGVSVCQFLMQFSNSISSRIYRMCRLLWVTLKALQLITNSRAYRHVTAHVNTPLMTTQI